MNIQLLGSNIVVKKFYKSFILNIYYILTTNCDKEEFVPVDDLL